MTTPLLSSILRLDGSNFINVNVSNGVIGDPPSGESIWGRNNALNIQNNDSFGSALDKIITFLEDSTISNSNNNIDRTNQITLSLNTYNAVSSMTGMLMNVIDSNKPQTNNNLIFYDNGGTLTGIVTYANNSIVNYDNILINTQKNSTMITTSIPLNNIGVKNFITVTNDDLQNGVYSLDFYMGGNSTSVPILNAGPSIFSYQLKHVNNSNINYLSNNLSFSVDNPINPSASTIGIFGISNIFPTGYVSGIPCLKNNDLVEVKFRANNCIRAFYNNDYVAKLFGVNVDTTILLSAPTFIPIPVSSLPIPGINGLNSSGGITNNNPIYTANITLASNIYFDKLSSTNLFINVEVQNSKGQKSNNIIQNNIINNNTNINEKIIVDSKSFGVKTDTFINEIYVIGEINRVKSGIGLFPSYTILPNGFSDDAFDNTIDANNNKELILLNGKYQFITGINYDFSINAIPIGPNYSSLIPEIFPNVVGNYNIRWVTFCKQFPSNIYFTRINFIINTDGLNYISEDVQANSPIISNVKIFITIRNGTLDMPWFDCNKSGINPQNEGDGCLDTTNSTLLNKYVSCGNPNTPRNGSVFIRIGLPINMSLTGIKFL
jgi:hypothetical protein